MKRILRAGVVLASTLLAANVMALDIGSKAPDFTAPSTHGDISLSDRLGKGPVVLAFYYADFTSG